MQYRLFNKKNLIQEYKTNDEKLFQDGNLFNVPQARGDPDMYVVDMERARVASSKKIKGQMSSLKRQVHKNKIEKL